MNPRSGLTIVAAGSVTVVFWIAVIPALPTTKPAWVDAVNDLPAALLHTQATRVDSNIFVVGGFLGPISDPNIYRAALCPNHTLATCNNAR